MYVCRLTSKGTILRIKTNHRMEGQALLSYMRERESARQQNCTVDNIQDSPLDNAQSTDHFKGKLSITINPFNVVVFNCLSKVYGSTSPASFTWGMEMPLDQSLRVHIFRILGVAVVLHLNMRWLKVFLRLPFTKKPNQTHPCHRFSWKYSGDGIRHDAAGLMSQGCGWAAAT